MRSLLIATLVGMIVGPAAIASAAPDDFSMPDQALFGLCTAYAHNENGREHGNAGNAPPFMWLADQAEAEDQTVEEFCGDVDHPGNRPA